MEYGPKANDWAHSEPYVGSDGKHPGCIIPDPSGKTEGQLLTINNTVIEKKEAEKILRETPKTAESIVGQYAFDALGVPGEDGKAVNPANKTIVEALKQDVVKIVISYPVSEGEEGKTQMNNYLSSVYGLNAKLRLSLIKQGKLEYKPTTGTSLGSDEQANYKIEVSYKEKTTNAASNNTGTKK